MKVRHLVMLTKEYPTDTDPIYPFVRQLARGFRDAGVRVTVIAPLSLTHLLLRRKQAPARRVAEGALRVLRPLSLSFSNLLPALNQWCFRRAVKRALPRDIDALYGHFVSPSGICAAELGEELGLPCYLGYGESSPAQYGMYGRDYLESKLRSLSGVVSVSSENARALRDQQILSPATRVGVFPNGADPDVFRPMDRAEARRALGLPEGAFIVGFVGAYSERKGARRLSEALKALEGVKSIFIGRGALGPDCPGLLHNGPLPHDQIPKYLAACDVFALPTRNEGCCNAIVEALSMGLPVVSSALPFNDDILSERNSLRIDPNDIGQIAAAIAQLRDDGALRERLSGGAIQSAANLSIGSRVQQILHFMEETSIETERKGARDQDDSAAGGAGDRM